MICMIEAHHEQKKNPEQLETRKEHQYGVEERNSKKVSTQNKEIGGKAEKKMCLYGNNANLTRSFTKKE